MDLITPELGLVFWTVFLLLLVLLPILALINISKHQFPGNYKVVWILVVIFMPFIGSLMYFIFGRSGRITK